MTVTLYAPPGSSREDARPAGSSSPASREGPRILYVFQGCFLHHSDGCHVRVEQTLDLLRRCGCAVTLYSYRNNPGWPWSEVDEAQFAARYPGWRLLLEDDSWMRVQSGRVRSLLTALSRQATSRIVRQPLLGLTPRLDELRAHEHFDFVFLNNASGFTEINGIGEARVLVDMHDFSALERLRLGRAGNLRGLWALRKELSYLSVADLIWCISFAEHSTVSELLDNKNVRFVPVTVELDASVGEAPTDGYDLLFVGSANRWNAQALLRFLADYERWGTRWRIAVAGRVCEDPRVRERAAAIGGIELLGFQGDLIGLYRKSAASLCPVEGTGTKIKIIEALAAGRPVFAYPGATRGLAPDFSKCVLPLEETAVSRVLGSRQSLLAASQAARHYSEAMSAEAISRSVAQDLL